MLFFLFQTRTFTDQIMEMSRRLAQLMPYLQYEIETKISPFFDVIAWTLAVLLAVFSLLRVLKEDNGAGQNVFWQIVRIGMVMTFFTTGYVTLHYMQGTGKDLSRGSDAGENVLVKLYRAQRDDFGAGYTKFIENQFMVKVDTGREDAVNPPANGSEALIVVLYDREGTIRDFDRRMASTFSLPNLLWGLNGIRSGLEFGDFFLMAIASITFMGLKLLVPFMIAMAMDKSLANRASYLHAVKNPMADPVATVGVCAFLMFVSMIILWGSPVLALWITLGKAYEAVSGMASNASGMLAGMGIEMFSAQAAAGFQRSADVGMTNAQQSADVTRSAGSWQSSNQRALGSNIKERASIEAGRIGSIGAAHGALTTQLMLITAGANQGHAMNSAESSRAQSAARADVQQGVGTTVAGATSELHASAADSSAQKKVLVDQTWGKVWGGLVPVVPAATAGANFEANQQRTWARNQAIESRSRNTIDALEQGGRTRVEISKNYQERVDTAIDTYAAAGSGAARAGFGEAAGAYNRAAGIAGAGVDRATEMEIAANRGQYEANVTAAQILQTAGIAAASNRALASIFANVGRELSRSVDRAMQFRY